MDLSTPCGVVRGAQGVEYWSDGTLRSVYATMPCELETPLGPLRPQFETDDMRKPRPQPVEFHENGALKLLPLAEQVPVTTPLGEYPAELVSFHPSGELRRVFPLNGKLSAYWNEADEMKLAGPLQLMTPVAEIEARFINIHFHPSGALASFTLWPGEVVDLPTPAGVIPVRIGAAFHESGAVRSVEPARPTSVATAIGHVRAFDNDPEGISGDANSLVFDETGRVERLVTTVDRVVVTHDGAETIHEPGRGIDACGEGEEQVTPLEIVFANGTIRLRTLAAAAGGANGQTAAYELATTSFAIKTALVSLDTVMFSCG
jgi:hypothetical protein